MRVDWIAAILAAMLAMTLTAYWFGWIPYPFGWIVLTLFLAVRALRLRKTGGG